EEQLGRIAGPDDEETAHEARIAGKRLRYLLEPLRGHAEGAKPAVDGMKELQDVLGELHDCAVLGAELGTAVAEAAADSARRDHERAWKGEGEAASEARPVDARPGLVALSRLVRGRRDELYSRLRLGWLDAGSDGWAEPIRGLAAELEAVELAPSRQRRFLLRALPEIPPDANSSLVDEGWTVTP